MGGVHADPSSRFWLGAKLELSFPHFLTRRLPAVVEMLETDRSWGGTRGPYPVSSGSGLTEGVSFPALLTKRLPAVVEMLQTDRSWGGTRGPIQPAPVL